MRSLRGKADGEGEGADGVEVLLGARQLESRECMIWDVEGRNKEKSVILLDGGSLPDIELRLVY